MVPVSFVPLFHLIMLSTFATILQFYLHCILQFYLHFDFVFQWKSGKVITTDILLKLSCKSLDSRLSCPIITHLQNPIMIIFLLCINFPARRGLSCQMMWLLWLSLHIADVSLRLFISSLHRHNLQVYWLFLTLQGSILINDHCCK